MILHITQRTKWEAAVESGAYRADTLAAQGFIHCSTVEQTVPVANALFKGQTDLVLLAIDSHLLRAEIRYENLEGGDELFPHIYGPIEIEAVTGVYDFPPQSDSTFMLPKVT